MTRVFSTVLLPGRHHLLTRFQAAYLRALLEDGAVADDGTPVACAPGTSVVWAVTSANHAGTRRNPVPYSRREAAVERLSLLEDLRSLVVPVVDVAPTARFAQTTLTSVLTGTGLDLTPEDTLLACSTQAVADMYRRLGFVVVGVEASVQPEAARPWDVLTALAEGRDGWEELTHPATLDVFERYRLVEHVRTVTSDTVVGDEGGLTDTRAYRSYMASFEAAAARKWEQARPYVRPGRIVDVGCASGAMLELAGAEPTLHESDLFGIEVARHLYEECVHKKAQGVFANPNTFFYQRNVLTGPVFAPRTIDTTLSFALTHEVYSYGGGDPALRAFARTIHDHTAPGGVWINSDVLGPEDGGRQVRLLLTREGVRSAPVDLAALDPVVRTAHLDALDGRSLLDQFAVDFRRGTGRAFPYEVEQDGGVVLGLADALELLTKASYTDNWLSETCEQFTALAWSDWVRLCDDVGFEVDPRSGPWRNDWLVENRFVPLGELRELDGSPLPWPDTHVLLVARRPLA